MKSLIKWICSGFISFFSMFREEEEIEEIKLNPIDGAEFYFTPLSIQNLKTNFQGDFLQSNSLLMYLTQLGSLVHKEGISNKVFVEKLILALDQQLRIIQDIPSSQDLKNQYISWKEECLEYKELLGQLTHKGIRLSENAQSIDPEIIREKYGRLPDDVKSTIIGMGAKGNLLERDCNKLMALFSLFQEIQDQLKETQLIIERYKKIK